MRETLVFNTKSPFKIYFLCNDISSKVLTAELIRMLEKTFSIDKEML